MGTTHVHNTYITTTIIQGIPEKYVNQMKASYEKAIKGLKEKNKNNTNKINMQNDQINSLRNEIKNLENDYEREKQEHKKENQELKKKIDLMKDKLKACVEQNEILTEKNNILEQQLKDSQETAQEYLDKWQQAKKELIEKNEKIAELEGENETQKEIILFLEGEINSFEIQCENQQKEIENLDKKYIKNVEDLKKDFEESKKINKEILNTVDKNNALMEGMKKEIEENKKEKEEMNRQMDSLNNKFNDMMSMMQQLLNNKK